ncbi:hypothetical protein ACIBQ1_13930 [Nonomuraea sp. NPDC050153]|uniref:hypothetical protein n=1 Tax=Nonomuraea sp. NPDC050153 TaxID=3364359 RepID=UPI00379FC87A
MDELRRALQEDPRACLLHRFAHTYFLAVADRPLLHRFLLDDPDLVGKLTGSPDPARDERHGAMARDIAAAVVALLGDLIDAGRAESGIPEDQTAS